VGDDSNVHVSYTLISHVVPAASHGLFAMALSTTTFTSRIVLWNKHQWAIKNVVIKDIVPVSEGNMQVHPGSWIHGQRVTLQKPEGLADVREGTEVEVGVEVLHFRDEKAGEEKQAMGENEGEYAQRPSGKHKGIKKENRKEKEVEHGEGENEGEYVKRSQGKHKGIEKENRKEKEMKQVKVMWEKSVDGVGGKKEGRFEWRCEEVGAGERLVLEAQWAIKGAPGVHWVETSA
jgi:hypothetical protein